MQITQSMDATPSLRHVDRVESARRWLPALCAIAMGPGLWVYVSTAQASGSANSAAGNIWGFVATLATQLFFCCLLAIVALWGDGQGMRELFLRRAGTTGWQPAIGVFGGVVAATIAGWLSTLWTHFQESGSVLEQGCVPAGLAAAAVVAITEELFAVALPIVLWRRYARDLSARRASTLLFLGALVVLRMAYHTHQGPGFVQHLPWAIVTVWAFWRWGRVWPLIGAHFVLDGLLALEGSGMMTQSTMLMTLFAASALPLAVVCVNARRARTTHQAKNGRASPGGGQ